MTVKTILLATTVAAFLSCSNENKDQSKVLSAKSSTPSADAKTLMTSFTEEWNKKDSAGLANMLADDALLISGRETMNGKKEIADRWIHHNMPLATNLTIHDLQANNSSELVTTTGTWSVDVAVPGRPAVKSTGNHTFVWKKESDGKWKLALLNMEDHDLESTK